MKDKSRRKRERIVSLGIIIIVWGTRMLCCLLLRVLTVMVMKVEWWGESGELTDGKSVWVFFLFINWSKRQSYNGYKLYRHHPMGWAVTERRESGHMMWLRVFFLTIIVLIDYCASLPLGSVCPEKGNWSKIWMIC